MKKNFCLIFFGLICRIAANPTCDFQFDSNQKYSCPLTDGNIDASFDGVIDGSHFESKLFELFISSIT